MIQIIPTLKLAGIIAAFAIVPGSLGGILAEVTIDNNTGIAVGLVLGAGGAVWYVATTLQRLKDRDKENSRRINLIERKLRINTTKEEED